MSRSRRKHPVLSDQQSRCSKIPKRIANRRVRHATDVPCGKAYRKYSCSWDICDYKGFVSPLWENGKAFRK